MFFLFRIFVYYLLRARCLLLLVDRDLFLLEVTALKLNIARTGAKLKDIPLHALAMLPPGPESCKGRAA